MSEEKFKKTTIGGQALIEGIMMVGPKRTAIAVRKGDKTIHVEEVKQSDKVTSFEKIPFVRGCIRFWKMMVTGTGALMKSADLSEEGAPNKENEKVSKADKFLEKNQGAAITISAVLGILLSVGLFILLPRLLVDLLIRFCGDYLPTGGWMTLCYNLLEGVFRMIFFFLYLIFASKVEGVERVWKYHGAEHKTISCYEAGEPLTVENIKKHTRFHPRCGTAFMFIVLAISIIIYSITGAIIGDDNMLVNILIRLLFIPLICGISFEILRFVGKHDKNPICKLLCKPGLGLQKFTTSEPDDSIIEVAIAAMQAVIPENYEDDIW